MKLLCREMKISVVDASSALREISFRTRPTQHTVRTRAAVTSKSFARTRITLRVQPWHYSRSLERKRSAAAFLASHSQCSRIDAAASAVRVPAQHTVAARTVRGLCAARERRRAASEARTRTDRRHRELELTVATAQAPTATCLLYTSPSPRDGLLSRMPSSA